MGASWRAELLSMVACDPPNMQVAVLDWLTRHQQTSQANTGKREKNERDIRMKDARPLLFAAMLQQMPNKNAVALLNLTA